jgi:hypothetical protein
MFTDFSHNVSSHCSLTAENYSCKNDTVWRDDRSIHCFLLYFMVPFSSMTMSLVQSTLYSVSGVSSSRGSSVGIADGWPWGRSSSPGKVKNFHLSVSSRPALGPTQPPIHWVPGALSPGVKRQEREADHSPPTSVKAKKTLIYITGSLWRHQSQQSFNTSTPFNFLFYSLHVSAPTGHPQVRYTISYYFCFWRTVSIQRIRCTYAIWL